jgi:crossover junction endodeoxyribonuclease RuvC
VAVGGAVLPAQCPDGDDRRTAGVALLVAARHGLPVGEPTPSEVKLAVCGNGTAGKKQVATMVGRLLGIQLNGAADDATDALAVAIGALRRGATA